MNASVIIQEDREELIRRCQRMTPEERLAAFAAHSQLMAQLHQAGVKYRAGRSRPSHRKRRRTG